MIDLGKLRPNWKLSEDDKPYMHIKCKTEFDIERKYPLCHCCKHRQTKSAALPAKAVSEICDPKKTFFHQECWNQCEVKSNYKGRLFNKRVFYPDSNESCDDPESEMKVGDKVYELVCSFGCILFDEIKSKN